MQVIETDTFVIEPTDHSYKTRISSNGFLSMAPLLKILIIMEMEMNRMTGARFPVTTKLFEKDGESIIIWNGLLEYILNYLIMRDYKTIFPKGTDFLYRKPLTINERFSELLSNPNYAVNGITQLSYLKSGLDNHGNGFFKFVTGYGKTELQIAMTESFLETHEGNVLIFAPTAVIVANFIERFAKYGIKIPKDMDTSSRINVINPTGICARKAYKSGEYDEYFKNVTMILADEAHHFGAFSWVAIVNKCCNVQYLYGFSGTPNLYSTHSPKIGECMEMDIIPANWGSQLSLVLQMTGLIKVDVSGKRLETKDIIIHNIQGHFASIPVNDIQKYNLALDHTFTNHLFTRALGAYINKYMVNRTGFFLIHKCETGMKLRENLITLCSFKEDEILYLESGTIIPHFPSLEDAKEHIDSGKVKLLIATTVAMEGFDTKGISTCFLASGRNVRFSLQVLGRSRAKDSVCVFFYDKGNPVLMSQSRAKTKTVYDEFGDNVIKSIKIDTDDLLDNSLFTVPLS